MLSGIPDDVEDEVGLNVVVPEAGVLVNDSSVGLGGMSGEELLVWVACKVGGERSSLPGEGEDLSRQSPA